MSGTASAAARDLWYGSRGPLSPTLWVQALSYFSRSVVLTMGYTSEDDDNAKLQMLLDGWAELVSIGASKPALNRRFKTSTSVLVRACYHPSKRYDWQVSGVFAVPFFLFGPLVPGFPSGMSVCDAWDPVGAIAGFDSSEPSVKEVDWCRSR